MPGDRKGERGCVSQTRIHACMGPSHVRPRGDNALSLLVDDHLLAARPVVSWSRARPNHGRGSEERAAEITGLATIDFERVAVPTRRGLPRFGKIRRVHRHDAGSDFETAGTADDNEALSPGVPRAADQGARGDRA